MRNMMTQCRMEKADGSYYTAYIPDRFATKGRVIDIDDVASGMRVVDVYHSLPYDVVNERGQDYKKTRLASDI